MKETITTTTTTTTRRLVPKPKPRLVKRVRKIVIRTSSVKGAKAVVRRTKNAAVPVKRAEVISVRTTKALPAPANVSELTVRERQRLSQPR